MPPKTLEWGHNPLTDPKSLGSSLAFHAAVLVAASLAVLGSLLPDRRDAGPTAFLSGEVGPVDNRAAATSGGGGPGEIGGTLAPDQVRMAADGRTADSQALPDPAADALLEDILPAPTAPDPSARALPGPLDLGIGVLPGPGTGGGGGEGGGSGGGQGAGSDRTPSSSAPASGPSRSPTSSTARPA